MQIKLTIGDVSGDGHSETEVYMLESTWTPKELEKRFEKVCKTYPALDPKKQCREYGESRLSVEATKLLKELGFVTKEMEKEMEGEVEYLEEDERGRLNMDADRFVNYLVFLLNLGSPGLVKVIKASKFPTLYLGNIGYGLF